MIKLFYGSMKASILASSSLAGACTQNLTFICQLFHSSKARGIYCLPKKKKKGLFLISISLREFSTTKWEKYMTSDLVYQ